MNVAQALERKVRAASRVPDTLIRREKMHGQDRSIGRPPGGHQGVAASDRAGSGAGRRLCSRHAEPAMLSGRPGGHETAPRILIVDDDPNLLVLLADQLRADGYEIQTARDGDEAL